MKYSSFVVTVLLFLTSHAMAEQLDGELLYEQNCSACHGQTGQGGTGVPLANRDFQNQVSDVFLANTIKYGRPGRVMPAFSNLSGDQIQAIVQHVRSFSPDSKPLKHDTTPVKGDVARMILYMDVRYEGGSGEPNLTAVNAINTSPDPEHGKCWDRPEWSGWIEPWDSRGIRLPETHGGPDCQRSGIRRRSRRSTGSRCS